MTDVKPTLICDTECYRNFWSIGFRRVSDGKIKTLEHSARKPFTDAERDYLGRVMAQNRIITYNGLTYDLAMIYLAINGRTNEQLKLASDRIIQGGLKYWEVENTLGVTIPKIDHIDLIEPQPNAFASLKTLQGRLHGRKMQDLPFHPDAILTPEQMDLTLAYMENDLDATFNVFTALKEPLELRETLSKEYGLDLRSKSDAQVGEALIKKRVEMQTKERAERVETPAGTMFKYPIPAYLKFENPELRDILDRLRTTDFIVRADGKVDMPAWLDGKLVMIDHVISFNGKEEMLGIHAWVGRTQPTVGNMKYAMGIGGLHSTEECRAIHSDDDYVLIDFDVASYYPAIIINSGLYPRALGRAFLDVFRSIRDERVAAKQRGKELDDAAKITPPTPELKHERDYLRAKEGGLKISLNGTFGKLGSRYSVLYAPHLMIAVTLTGQLSLLMLIEWAETTGISVVSANTDGVVFRVPRSMAAPIVKDRLTDGPVKALIERWEAATGFVMEATEYQSIYNQSVNSYVAVKPDSTVKWKGPLGNPWRSGPGWKPDLRQQLMKNPQMTIVSNAVVDLITKGTPIEETIRASRDIREFVTVVNVKGGGTWRGDYLGKVVRYYWAKGGEEILYKTPHAATGNFKKVSKSDGCRPLMELPEEFPGDIDYDRYAVAAREILMDIGYNDRPPPIKPIRIYKYNAIAWFALAV